MSIMNCERHDIRWDSDQLEECPKCAEDPLITVECSLLQECANFLGEIRHNTGLTNFTDRANWHGRSKRLYERLQQEISKHD